MLQKFPVWDIEKDLIKFYNDVNVMQCT